MSGVRSYSTVRACLLVCIVRASHVRQHLGVVHRRAPSVHGVIERVLLQTEQRAGVVFMVFTKPSATSACRSLADEQPVECALAAAREHLESHTCRVHGRARHLCGLSTRRRGAREAVLNRSTDPQPLALRRLSQNGVLRGAAQSGGALLHKGGGASHAEGARA